MPKCAMCGKKIFSLSDSGKTKEKHAVYCYDCRLKMKEDKRLENTRLEKEKNGPEKTALEPAKKLHEEKIMSEKEKKNPEKTIQEPSKKLPEEKVMSEKEKKNPEKTIQEPSKKLPEEKVMSEKERKNEQIRKEQVWDALKEKEVKEQEMIRDEEIKLGERVWESPKIKSKKNIFFPLVKWFIFILLISMITFLAIWFYQFAMTKDDVGSNTLNLSEPKNESIFVNKTIIRTVQDNISFAPYFNARMEYHNKMITLKGLLGHKLVNLTGKDMQLWVYYTVDDYGNEITLTKMNPKYEKMFILRGITSEVYDITGTFIEGGPELQVKNMTLSSRTTKEITETFLEQVR